MIWLRTLGSSRLVSANGPSRLVPSVISKPSTVSVRRSVRAPALLIRMSTGASIRSAKARNDDRSARSSFSTAVDPPIWAARSFPSSVLRTARITSAPALARARAVPSPTPLVAPVTITRLPVRSPSRSGVHGMVTANQSNGRFYVSWAGSANIRADDSRGGST